MDPNFLLLALLVVVSFASVSVVSSLHSIRDATKKALALLESQAGEELDKT